MHRKLAAPLALAVALTLAIAVPALAGGANCSGAKGASAAAWTGAWLQRSAAGIVTVADVSPGSPAARAGLKSGDVVTAVNGHDTAECSSHAMCSSSAECKVGSAMTYRVQRGHSTRAVKVKLERLPDSAAQRYANRNASFDPAFAAIVMPAVD